MNGLSSRWRWILTRLFCTWETRGALQSATNYESHVIQNFDVPSRIGNDAYSAIDRTFDGMIDEMAVFNRTLSLEAGSPCVIHPDAAKKFYRVVVQ
ncbi:MAG TPA: hypothetical protein VFD66_06785 [Verrucomicrobiae bacterium]|nr:hypothetical protein [Verrucomicrobiae bacterium]